MVSFDFTRTNSREWVDGPCWWGGTRRWGVLGGVGGGGGGKLRLSRAPTHAGGWMVSVGGVAKLAVPNRIIIETALASAT